MKKSWESCTDVYTHVPFVLTKLKISREKSKEKRVFLLSIMFTGNNLFKIFLIDVTRSSDGQNLESIGSMEHGTTVPNSCKNSTAFATTPMLCVEL